MTRAITFYVHSFSLRYHLRHPDLAGGYSVFRHMERMKALGFDGVNISANGPGYRDLGGMEAAHFGAVKAELKAHGLGLEMDTSDTAVAHMATMLAVCAACGGDTLRTYTRYRGETADLIARTIRDLKAIAPQAEDLGVTIVLENHEDFTGPQIGEILAAVDHPRIRALYDYGNSQMLGEDPLVALAAMAPFIHTIHLKDHVLVEGADGQLFVQGTVIGDGRLPIMAITDRLYDLGQRRFCFESVWAYAAPLAVDRARLPATPSFAFDEAGTLLRGDDLAPADAVAWEGAAFDRGLAWVRQHFTQNGYRAPVLTSAATLYGGAA